jgi:NADH dehydrogenase
MMSIQQATVFGGSGFIGRYVVQELAKAGLKVRVAVRRPDRALFLKAAGDVGQIAPVQSNVRDDASVAAAVEGADLVINLVGVLLPRGAQNFDAVHREAAGRIALAARDAGATRLIHFSAMGADDASPSQYGRSKSAGEAAVSAAFPGATILRPSIVVGQEDKFFNMFAGFARLSPVLPLIGGGATKFQPVTVSDVAAATLAAASRAECAGQIYELGGPKVYSFKDLLEIMLTEIRRRRLLVPVPFGVAQLMALPFDWFPVPLEWLPIPVLTRDQVSMLRVDNVAGGDYPGLRQLDIEPAMIDSVLPNYLNRYRRAGSEN